MIVSDKAKTLAIANELSNHILIFIGRESEKFKAVDDPAEHIYLACHIMGMLFYKICDSYTQYGQIYNIPNLNEKTLREWINKIADEYINGYKSN